MFDIDKKFKEKAKRRKPTILIAEGWDERVLRAVHDLKNMANFILLGKPKTILENVKKWKLNIGKTEIIDHLRSEKREELAKALYELRKEKGMTPKEANALMDNVNYFGCMMVHQGYAEGIASSVICSTADIMHAALRILKKKDTLVSELAVAKDVKNDRILFMTDGTVNISPTPEQLAQIATHAIQFVKSIDITPKVSFLSFSTKGSGGDGIEIQQVREAVKICQKMNPKVLIDGEMQFDASVSPKAAVRKCPDSPLKGNANLLIFPNLNAGNILFHALLQLSDVHLAYAITLGTAKPVSVLGRSTPLETVKGMLLVNMMECNKLSNEKRK